MTDDDFERAVVSWLALRGYLVQKLESTPVYVSADEVVEAFTLPETPLNRPESRFDEFWALYPRKIGKEAARKTFEKLEYHNQVRAVLGLKAHLDAEAFSDEKCYIKHPSTWLNQKVYLDEPEKRSFKKPQVGGQTEKRKALDDWLND